MPKIFAILLLFIMFGQTVQPAFAGDCCSEEMEMHCGEKSDDLNPDKNSCCSAPSELVDDASDELPHDCGDDCQCFCCFHVVFDLPQLKDFSSPEHLLPELNISYPTYFFQISIPVFQPPQWS